jgi:hypothetical protein
MPGLSPLRDRLESTPQGLHSGSHPDSATHASTGAFAMSVVTLYQYDAWVISQRNTQQRNKDHMSPRDFPSGGCSASTSWPGSIGALVCQLSEFRSRRIIARVENRPPSSPRG